MSSRSRRRGGGKRKPGGGGGGGGTGGGGGSPRDPNSGGTGRMNADWHAANPIPVHASLDVRAAWHVAHQRSCGCRPMPASIAELVNRARRGPIRPGAVLLNPNRMRED